MKFNDPKFLNIFDREYRRDNRRLIFISESAQKIDVQKLESGINKLKTFLKKWPGLYNFLTKTISVELFVGFTPKKAIKRAFGLKPDERIIINVGSGVIRLHPEVVNLDIAPFQNVDIVADVQDLPFKDNSIDMIIAESLLEHVEDAPKAIAEIQRVLKPGGYVWVKIPFMYPFHDSPNDFYRWTHEGIKKAFDKCRPVSVGVFSGPMTTFLATLAHWLALLFSFGSKRLHPFLVSGFMAILSPLKIFDLVFRLYPASIESAAFLYFFGKRL